MIIEKQVLKLALLGGVILAIFFSGYGVRDYMAKAELTRIELAQKDKELKAEIDYTDKLNALLVENNALQERVTALDTQHTKALNEELEKNRTLRNDLRLAQRMRLTGTTCPETATTEADSATGSLGNGTGVELSESTRLAVWDLREALIRDTAKVSYLQEYIRTTCPTVP